MKKLYLIRGVSGSGKTTFAETLNILFTFSADMYFEDESGNYHFDAKYLKDAHEWCRKSVKNIMIQGHSVVVANTFTQEWEMQPYYDLAEKYGYTVFSVIVENRHGNKSVHNVPEETLKKQKERFEIKL